jgi:glutathione S-transferase
LTPSADTRRPETAPTSPTAIWPAGLTLLLRAREGAVGRAPHDVPARDAAHDAIVQHLDVLERRLGERDWVVGDYSLADVCYAPVVTGLDRVGLGHLWTVRPAVTAWVARLNGRRAVQETVPPHAPLTIPPRS